MYFKVLSLLLVGITLSLATTVDVLLTSPRPGYLNFTVFNPSSSSIKVLTIGTPLEGDIFGQEFRVYNPSNGEEISYIGKIARRVWPASSSNYLILNAGQSVSEVVNINKLYAFEKAGKYVVDFIVPSFDDIIVTFKQPQSVSVSILSDFEDNNNNDIITSKRENTNCNGNQNSQIASAVNGAITESRSAYNCMNARTCLSLAVTWFGTYNQGNYDYDKQVFNSVNNRLTNFEFNGYCNPAGCPNNVYAYVYPNDRTFTVYLCGAFWSQPAERVNTIVHEMSHFDSLGGTDDYAYGKSACLSLARSNPSRASHNADNVCYFSEEASFLFPN